MYNKMATTYSGDTEKAGAVHYEMGFGDGSRDTDINVHKTNSDV